MREGSGGPHAYQVIVHRDESLSSATIVILAAAKMSSCFGWPRAARHDDTQPLLPRYEDDSLGQKRLHQKLHTYHMLRALAHGYMPSTEQAIIRLRTLLASDLLNPNNKDLSESGRSLLRLCRTWLKLVIELLKNKNSHDQIQDFIWYLARSRMSLNIDGIARQPARASPRADTAASESGPLLNGELLMVAAYEALRTIGSLLLTNTDFRLFVADLSTIGRQVLADSAFKLSGVAQEAGQKLELSEEERGTIRGAGADDATSTPSREEIAQNIQDVTKVVGDGAAEAGKAAVASAKDNLAGEQSETLLYRVKQAVVGLRRRTDYQDSVSTIAKLIRRYAYAYSQAANETLSAIQDDVQTTPDLDRAARNFWLLTSSFGDPKQWEQLEHDYRKVMEHVRNDPQLEDFMTDIGNTVQKMLTDAAFFDNASERIDELKHKSSRLGNDSGFRTDFDKLLRQAQVTLRAAAEDPDISKLVAVTTQIYKLLSPPSKVASPDLLDDCLNIFLPLLIRTIQYIPIPRVEVSAPEMDLLLENLVLEPGRNVNATSFLPYRLLVSTKSDLEIRKAHSKKTVSAMKSLITVSINGLSVAAHDLGFWIRGHAGLVHFADEGIASFALDERGIDITLHLEFGREKLEQILTLRGVRVHIHKLDYTLRKSKLSWLGWLFKPFLKHLIRRSLEKRLAESIVELLHAANRELVFARERLRATRIADPQDIFTFIKAVMARLTPADDPDICVRVGVDASKSGVFKNTYTPSSVVKVWREEALRVEEAVEQGEEASRGWRNNIFNVPIVSV